MASRLTHTSASMIPSVVLGIAIMTVFVVLIGKHYDVGARTISNVANDAARATVILGNRTGILDTCGDEGAFIAFSPTVYVCSNARNELIYDEIYTTYPATGGGREVAYDFLNDGSRERADEMLENIYYIERYEPVTLDAPLTWTEDPFGERYWRFLFYSLRPTRHLLATATETGNEQYYDKLREIIESFLTTGMEQPYAWDDHHGVAFRTMVLVNTWWQLRAAGELPDELSDDILAALEVHGNFLLDPAHYEAGNNHAVTQATALLVLAHSFPDLTNAATWRDTAIERIDDGLAEIIDDDGVLIENSPYYHFYVLEKYWEIRAYTTEQDIAISDSFNETIDRMIEFATYVLTPDLQPPLLGASIPREIGRSGEFREIAETYPEFNYVMTRGRRGSAPPEVFRFYPSSGIALMRSGWGTERPYEEELHVLFDTGPYRTDHSDLDALTFSAYAAGAPVVRDAGLYTYEDEHPYYNYFYGTNGQNTIMVDGQNQRTGTGRVDRVAAEDTYAYVIAQHDLYPGVVHNRSLMQIEHGAVLIIDHVISDTPHTYEQLFHLSEHADINEDSARLVTGTVRTERATVPFSIEQFAGSPTLTVWHEDTSIPRGLCATAYETAVPCYELSYEIQAPAASYVTLIRLGNAGMQYRAVYDEAATTLTVSTDTHEYEIDLTFPDDASSYVDLSVNADARGGNNNSPVERIRAFLKDLF